MRTEEGRVRHGFSAADAFWILAVAVVLVLAFIFLLPAKGEKEDTCRVRYVLRVHGVDSALLAESSEELIRAGATVRTENGTAVLGHVEAVTVSSQKQATVRDGVLIFTEVPDKLVIEVAVSGEGVAREGQGLRISDVRMAAGSVGTFRLGSYYATHASVIFVERIDGEDR